MNATRATKALLKGGRADGQLMPLPDADPPPAYLICSVPKLIHDRRTGFRESERDFVAIRYWRTAANTPDGHPIYRFLAGR